MFPMPTIHYKDKNSSSLKITRLEKEFGTISKDVGGNLITLGTVAASKIKKKHFLFSQSSNN